MPLQRDVQRTQTTLEQQEAMARKVDDYTGRKQKERSSGRPQTPLHEERATSKRHLPSQTDTFAASAAGIGLPTPNHSKQNSTASATHDDELRKKAASLKLSVGKMLPPRAPKLATGENDQIPDSGTQRQIRNSHEKTMMTSEHEPKNAFDDTASFDLSELDNYSVVDDVENETQIFRPQPFYPHQFNKTSGDLDDADRYAEPSDHLVADLDLNLEEERQVVGLEKQPQKHTKQNNLHHNRDSSLDAAFKRTRNSHAPNFLETMSETPSRTSSVPPRSSGATKVAGNKSVAFADSPTFKSADLAREDSPELLGPRAVTEQVKAYSLPLHSKGSESSHYSDNARNATSSSAPVSNRFQQRQNSNREGKSQEQGPNYRSAATVDLLQSSDQDFLPHLENPAQVGITVDAETSSSKRRRDEIDYDLPELKNKTLQELQNENFSQDPRAGDRAAPVDSHGNAMILEQILTNLNKMDPSQQEAVFRAQTDEEWSRTGAWFVEQFEANLKLLVDARVERRKVALKFENEIRRRQAEVDRHAAQVDKDLASLQQGGHELVKDRKPASRCATPMKAVDE